MTLDRELRRCHRCGRRGPADEASCGKCGAVLSAICSSPQCGTTFRNDLDACPACGEHNEPHVYRSPYTAKRIVFALVVVGAVVAGSVWAFDRHLRPKPGRERTTRGTPRR